MSGSAGALINQLANPPMANPQYWGQQMSNLNALQDYSAKQATAEAYRQAVDPATGQLDPGKFNALVSQGPAAWNAGPAMQQAGQAQGAQAQAQNVQTAGHIARLTYMQGAMTDLLQNPNTTMTDVVDRIHQIAKTNIVTPDEANAMAVDAQSFQGNPHDWLLNHSVANQSATDQLKSQVGGIERVDQGGVTTFNRIQPAVATSGAPQGGPVVPMGPHPDTMTDIVSLHVPGQPDQQMTRAQAITALRGNPALAPLNTDWLNAPPAVARPPGGTGGPATTTAAPPATRTPVTATPLPSPATPAAAAFQPTAARADAAGTATATPGAPQYGSQGAPGQLATRETQATTGANLAQQMEIQGQDAATKIQPQLAGMLAEIQGAGTSGVTSTVVGRVRQLAIAAGLTPPAIDITNQQAAQEALGKLFAQYEAQQLGSLGSSPSDSRQNLAAAGSPSLFNTPEGNRQIIRNLQGNNDALDTMYRSWMGSQTRATNPGNYAAWRSAFTAPVASGPLAGARFDPTVFAVNRMSPDEQRTYLTNLQKASPSDFAQLRKNWELGLKEGWVKPLSGQ
jgi:hypothetical protein